MLTFSGKEIDISNIKTSDIDDLSIAVSLSRINRFVGHTAYPYSDAQHSLLVCSLVGEGPVEGYAFKDKKQGKFKLLINSDQIRRRLQLYSLLHDAHEFLTNDIPSPIKEYLKPNIVVLEHNIQAAIWRHFQVEPPSVDEANYIKSLDIEAYEIENRNLRDIEFKRLEHPFLGSTMGPMDPNLVALVFLRKLKQLGA